MAKAKREPTNVVSLSWENTFELHLLPIGDGLLSPEEAARWLSDDVSVYTELVIACARCKGDTHDALATDFGYMAEAAGRALTSQKPVRLGRTTSPDDPDNLRGLAHLLVHFERLEDVQRQEQRELGALARELEARLALATEVQR